MAALFFVEIPSLSFSRSFYVVFLFLLSPCLFSAEASLVSKFQQEAGNLHLSKSHAWQRLLHINKRGESYVDDKKFFLSAKGKINPRSELFSTIERLLVEPALQCQFPQRSRWLSQQLQDFSQALPPLVCDEYLAWRERLAAHSVTLVLAASFLNSPSSMYGHTFLRFDKKGYERGKSLSSYAVNFGAVMGDDAGIMYAYNGLFGGYPGYFSDGPYFEKVKEYSRFDNRDVWEYRLNLTPQETDVLLAHLWELNNIRFDYYFFDENCSFRLLELLEVARDGTSLATHFDVYAVPLDTVRVTEQAGLIEGVVFRPSNRSKLSFNIAQLSKGEQKLALALAEDSNVWVSEALKNLPDKKRYKVVEVAYQYLRYQNNRGSRNQQMADQSFFLLKKMRELSVYAKEEAVTVPVQPEKGHDTRAWIFTGGHDEAAFIDVEFRAAYHDLLDNALSYPSATKLVMAGIKLRLREGNKLQLQNLDIVNISSLNPRSRFFKPLSWRIGSAVERQWTNGDDELVAKFDGGVGWTLPVVGNLHGFAMADARIEYNPGFEQSLDVALGASLGLILQHEKSSFMAEVKQYHFSDGVDRQLFEVAYQLPLAKNHGLRLQVKRMINDDDKVSESSLSYRFYY